MSEEREPGAVFVADATGKLVPVVADVSTPAPKPALPTLPASNDAVKLKALDILGGAVGSTLIALLAILGQLDVKWAFAGILGLSGGVAVLQRLGIGRGVVGAAGGVAALVLALAIETPFALPLAAISGVATLVARVTAAHS